MTKMADILQSTRAWLGGVGEDLIPDVLTDAETVKAAIVDWLKSHAETLKIAGSTFSLGLVHALMGVLLAILVFFRHVTHHDARGGALAEALEEKVHLFADAFSRIATAQVKISAVNTSLTALYLLVVLPLFGIHLPFSTTIVLITFVCGLIPVLGNLISNTVIVILSLGALLFSDDISSSRSLWILPYHVQPLLPNREGLVRAFRTGRLQGSLRFSCPHGRRCTVHSSSSDQPPYS